MDKKTAIKEAYEERKRKSEADFRSRVKVLIWDIETTSNRLRDLKAELTKLEYEELEIQGGILMPETEED